MQRGKLRSQDCVNMAQSGTLGMMAIRLITQLYICVAMEVKLHWPGMEIHCKLWLLLKNYSFRGELNCRISEWHQRV